MSMSMSMPWPSLPSTIVLEELAGILPFCLFSSRGYCSSIRPVVGDVNGGDDAEYVKFSLEKRVSMV